MKITDTAGTSNLVEKIGQMNIEGADISNKERKKNSILRESTSLLNHWIIGARKILCQ